MSIETINDFLIKRKNRVESYDKIERSSNLQTGKVEKPGPVPGDQPEISLDSHDPEKVISNNSSHTLSDCWKTFIF